MSAFGFFRRFYLLASLLGVARIAVIVLVVWLAARILLDELSAAAVALSTLLLSSWNGLRDLARLRAQLNRDLAPAQSVAKVLAGTATPRQQGVALATWLGSHQDELVAAARRDPCGDDDKRPATEAGDEVAKCLEILRDHRLVPQDVDIAAAVDEFLCENECATRGWSLFQVVHHFAAERSVGVGCDGYVGDDDHAGLVGEIARLTQGEWAPQDVRSRFDARTHQGVIEFSDQGRKVSWRFNQPGDDLAPSVFSMVLRYVAQHTGGVFKVFRAKRWLTVVYLPKDAARELSRMGAFSD